MQKKTLNSFDDRSKLLLGEKFGMMKNFKFAICGVGGVGSIIPLSLVRSGVKKLILVDFDKVDPSNLNRQLAYNANDIGKSKVNVLKTKLESLRDDLSLDIIEKRIDEDFDFSIFNNCDYVFDCIDDFDAKVNLIIYCLKHDIKIISSLGMGNRLDSSKIVITTLNKTFDDPLARKLRYVLKTRGVDIKKLLVSFSTEHPIISGNKISSMVFVPNVAGLIMASHVINELLN